MVVSPGRKQDTQNHRRRPGQAGQPENPAPARQRRQEAGRFQRGPEGALVPEPEEERHKEVQAVQETALSAEVGHPDRPGQPVCRWAEGGGRGRGGRAGGGVWGGRATHR